MPQILSKKEVNKIVSCYPNKEAALMPVLRAIQMKEGYISKEAEHYAAAILELHPSRVREVVAFYSMFREKPEGKHLILVCESISCALLGSETILEHLKKRLAIGVGETTADKCFTLETAECLACCDQAPSVMINDELFGPVTPEQLDGILEEKRKG
jgi:NADH-quinone oxidoreductase subunit E